MASRRKNRVKGIFKKGKPKFIGLSNEKPPKTERYCVQCRANRIFKFNPSFGHSECTICGNRFARRIK
jgi:hypothetical protein